MIRNLCLLLVFLLSLSACRSGPKSGASGEAPAAGAAAIRYYTCSMHPQIRMDEPGQCPICGMNLVPVYAESLPAEGPEAAVPGQAALNLNAERRQRIGLRSEAVRRGPLRREIFVPSRVAYDPDLMVAQSDYLIAASTGGGDLGGLQGGLVKAAKLRLRSLGMSEAQIAALRARGRPETGLLIGDSGSATQIYASVFESDLPWIKAGMPVEVELPGGPTLSGQIASLDPVLNPETRTLTLRFSLPNPGGRLRPQMYLRAKLRGETEPVLSVPEDALLDTGATQVVYVEAGEGSYRARHVRVGRRGGGQVEILSGLQEGERVVTQGSFLLDAESRLKAPPGEEAAAPPVHDHGSAP